MIDHEAWTDEVLDSLQTLNADDVVWVYFRPDGLGQRFPVGTMPRPMADDLVARYDGDPPGTFDIEAVGAPAGKEKENPTLGGVS